MKLEALELMVDGIGSRFSEIFAYVLQYVVWLAQHPRANQTIIMRASGSYISATYIHTP